MRNTHLVIKRFSNGRIVSPKLTLWKCLLIADYLNSEESAGGIVEALLPKTSNEIDLLRSLKQKYFVEEVFEKVKRSKENDELRDYFKKNAFIVALCEWWIKNYVGRTTLDRITTELAKAHKIITSDEAINTPKLLDLENIFKKHAPKLLDTHRNRQWWEQQIAKRN